MDLRAERELLAASDSAIAAVIDALGGRDPAQWWATKPNVAPFASLVRLVLAQQISAKVAARFFERLDDATGHEIEPSAVLALGPAGLNSIGLSQAKIRTLGDLSERMLDGRLDLDGFASMPDDEVKASLHEVWGIGAWTTDFFLLRDLDRPDVLPAGDLGVRRAIQRLFDLNDPPTIKEASRLGERWRPRRSLATQYLLAWYYGLPEPEPQPNR